MDKPPPERPQAAAAGNGLPGPEDSRRALLFMLEDLAAAHKQIDLAHQQWMAALDAVDDPIFLHDAEGRILRANRAYQRCAGVPFEAIIGQPYHHVFPKLDAPLPACADAMHGGSETMQEISVGGRGYRSRVFPVHDEQGVFLYSVHVLEDVTEHLQMAQAVQEVNDKLHAIMDNSQSLIYMADVEGRFQMVNRAFAQLFHMEPEQMLGQPREALMPKESAQQHRDNDLQIMRSGQPLTLEETNPQEDGLHTYLTVKFPLRKPDGSVYAVAGISSDITERKRHEAEILRVNRALRVVSAGNQALIHASEEQALLQQMCRTVVETGGYRMAWVGYLQDDIIKSVLPMAYSGFEESYLETVHITWADEEHGRGPTGRAARSGRTQIAQNIDTDPSLAPWRENALKHGYAASIALPLMDDGSKCFGVITMYDAAPDAFDAEEVKVLEELAGDLAFGIVTLRMRKAHQEHERRLQQNMLQTVRAISGIVEMRDPYTAGHQARVGELARAIGREMGLAEDTQHAIYLAGLVHDLGKIRIPAEILSKPGRLSELEYDLIKLHPQAGYDILKGVEFSWPIARMVLEHHERLDGSGYPQGLQGDDILPESRILCVADVLEAMASHRPYRPSLGIEAGLGELSRGRGSLYDAQVVDACLRLFREKAYVMPR